MTEEERIINVRLSDYEQPGLYLTLKDSTRLDFTRENIEKVTTEYWMDSDKIPANAKKAAEFQRCAFCPLKGRRDLCDALRPTLPLLHVMDKYNSFDEVTAVYKGDEKGLCHVSYTSMQRALRYISNLSLMGYCQVGRKYWKYFSGTIPVMGTEEIANRVYLNIYWIHKGDKERVDQVISKLNSEIIITTQNQMERLRLICKNDALLNAFVLTHMTTDVLYENKDTKLRELMESFEKNTRPSQNFNGKGTGVSSKRFNARSKEFLFGQQPDKVRPLSPNKAFPLSSNVTPSLKEVVMKILGFIASPRKGSNTDTLVDETLKGSDVAGHTYEKLQLYNYEISACIDCRKCKKGDFVCVVKDSMQEIYPKMDEADLIIFGMPNYWYGPTAKMKLLIDRMRPYIANGKLKGKKVVVVTPAAEGPDACGPLIEMFGMSFRQLDMEFTGKILATAYERGEIKSNQESLKSAYDLGASLQTSYAVVEKEGSGLNIGHLC